MKAIAVNLNLYSSDEEFQIILEDLESLGVDYVVIFGSQQKVQLIIPKLGKIKYLYLGFSPLSLNYVCDIFSILLLKKKLAVDITIQLYEKEEMIKCSESTLFHFLSNYLKSDNGYKYLSSLDEICSHLDKIPHNNFTTFIKKFISFLSYDKFIKSVFNYQHLSCETNDIKREIWGQINNKSIMKNMYKLSIDNIKNYKRWQNLKQSLDLYIYYAAYENARALLFYHSLFLRISVFYKNILKSALCYLFLLRSLEALSTFYLLNKNYLSLEGGTLVFTDTKNIVNGAGSLFSFMENIEKIPKKSVFYKLLYIRNQSYVGHGFHSPQLDKFDDIYIATAQLSSSLLSKEEEEFKIECENALSFNSKHDLNSLYSDISLIKKEWYIE